MESNTAQNVSELTPRAPVFTPPKLDKLVEALAKAQSAIQNPPRNREVTVKTKTGGSYKFKYATLDAIIDAVRKPLTDNGLWFTQRLEQASGRYQLVTVLMHSSGQQMESTTPLLVDGGGNQEFGSALTYMRRYALTALLGIAADEDDDGNAADGNTVQKSSQKDAKPKEPTMQDRANTIGRAIKATRNMNELNEVWDNNAPAIDDIKKASERAHQALLDMYNKQIELFGAVA